MAIREALPSACTHWLGCSLSNFYMTVVDALGPIASSIYAHGARAKVKPQFFYSQRAGKTALR